MANDQLHTAATKIRPSTSILPDTLYDMAVVGAGPAGSAIAASLAEHGWRVCLIERDEFPRHKVCGEFISPDAQVALHKLGLHGEIAALQPIPLTAARIVSPYGSKLRRPLPGVAWGLSRYTFDSALAAAAVARGAELYCGMTVTRSLVQDGKIELHLHHRKQPTVIHARSAIMAYGRVAMPGLATAPASSPRATAARTIGAKCHFEGVQMPNQVELYFFPGGYAGLNRVEGGRANLCLLATYEAFAAAGRSIAGILAAAIAANPALATRMEGANALPETECAVAPVDTYRRQQPWGTFAQLGDSAVMLPPLCGDGMAMALQSALLCAPLADSYLRGELSFARWEQLYRRAWQREFGQRVWMGRQLQRLLQIPTIAEGLLMTGMLFPKAADYFITATRGRIPAASPVSA